MRLKSLWVAGQGVVPDRDLRPLSVRSASWDLQHQRAEADTICAITYTTLVQLHDAKLERRRRREERQGKGMVVFRSCLEHFGGDEEIQSGIGPRRS